MLLCKWLTKPIDKSSKPPHTQLSHKFNYMNQWSYLSL